MTSTIKFLKEKLITLKKQIGGTKYFLEKAEEDVAAYRKEMENLKEEVIEVEKSIKILEAIE